MSNSPLGLFAYPWDIIDEGEDAVIDAVKRAGLNIYSILPSMQVQNKWSAGTVAIKKTLEDFNQRNQPSPHCCSNIFYSQFFCNTCRSNHNVRQEYYYFDNLSF